MIRHQVAAQNQILIGILFISAVLLMGALKHVFGYSGFLTLTDAARIEVYLLGVFAALLFLHERWTELLQGAFLRAPFESIMLATRLAFCQGVAFTLIYFLMRDIAVSRAFLIWFIAIGLPVNSLLIIWLPGLLRRFFNRTSAWRGVLVGRGNIPHSLLDYAERCRFFGVEFNPKKMS